MNSNFASFYNRVLDLAHTFFKLCVLSLSPKNMHMLS